MLHIGQREQQLANALNRTQIRYYSASREFIGLLEKLRNANLDEPRCCMYKIRMAKEIISSEQNVKDVLKAIQSGKIKGVKEADLSKKEAEGDANYWCPAWKSWGPSFVYPETNTESALHANGYFWGYFLVEKTSVDDAIKYSFWQPVERTMFHEISHIGAATIDDDSHGFANNAHVFEKLYDSIEWLIDQLDENINSGLPNDKKCPNSKW